MVPAPINRKAQEVQGARPLPALVTSRRTPKLDQAGLVRVQPQFVSRHPFLQGHLRPLRILVVLKADDEVSRPGEFHPQALAEPCVNLSAHTAPIIQP